LQVDWFTLVAQVVNFLVLMALLRRFLYRPLLSAMARRQEEIDRRLEEGASMQREARESAEALERERRELEARRDEKLRAAERDAEQRRVTLLEEAREQVEERRRRWHEALDRERESFLDELRGRVAGEVVAVAQRALADLAGADLEDRVVDRFVARLEELGSEGRRELARSLERALERSDEEAVVTSAFELPAGARRRIARALEGVLPDGREIRFATSAGVGFGVELVAGGVELGWSLDRYLSELDHRIGALLAREAGRTAGGGVAVGPPPQAEGEQ
jgi:F-type H+-transporting ATPase subunit b